MRSQLPPGWYTAANYLILACCSLHWIVLCSPTHHRIGHEDDLLFHSSFLEEIGVIRHHAPMIGIHSSLSAHHNGFHGHRLCPTDFTCINYEHCNRTNKKNSITPSQIGRQDEDGVPCNDASGELICCRNSSLAIEDNYEPQEELPEAEEQRQPCPTGSHCVDYRSCINGGESSSESRHTSRILDILKLSYEKSMKLGAPCSSGSSTSSEREVCCKEETESEEEKLDVDDQQQCIAGFECVHYRSCGADRLISNFPSRGIPSYEKWLGLIGAHPCGNETHQEMLCCEKKSYLPPSSSLLVSPTTEPARLTDDSDCPAEKLCISYRFCRNGFVSYIPSNTAISPTHRELTEFGKPCGRSGREVCCNRTPPVINSRAQIAAQIKSDNNEKDSMVAIPIAKSPWSSTLEAILHSIVTAFANNLVGCPTDSTCINYRFCNNGVVTQVPSSFGVTGPTLIELAAFGTPCGKMEVCCKSSSQSALIGISNIRQKTLPEITMPPCPDGSNCINYRGCARGVVSNVRAGFDLIGPSFEELKEYGRPCGKSEVCCRGTLPSNSTTSRVESRRRTTLRPTSTEESIATTSMATERPRIRPSKISSLDPNPVNTFRSSSSNRPTVTPTTSSTSSVAIQQPFYNNNRVPIMSNVIHQKLSTPNRYFQRNKDSIIPEELQIAFEDHQNECASRSYKCVPKYYCSLEGVVVYNPLHIPNYRQQGRVPLTSCWNSKLKRVGFCCRDDPNYSTRMNSNNVGNRRNNFYRYP